MEDLQYWVVGGALAVCAASFFLGVVPLFALGHLGPGKPPPMPTGNVPIAGFGVLDVVGVGLFFGLYSMMWMASTMTEIDPAEIELTPLVLFGEILVQAFMVAVVFMFLFWRMNVVRAFGLRWQKWYLAPLLGIPVVFLIFSFTAVLALAGYDDWMAKLQGLEGSESTEQEVVTMMKEASDPLTVVMMTLLACVGAPLAEEVVFRGYIYPAVKRLSNIPYAIIFSGLLFAAVHGNLAALLPLFVLGLVLAGLYELTGSLWMPITIHFLFNTTSVTLMRLQAAYPEWFEEPAWRILLP